MNDAAEQPRGSTAHMPDLDWSQVRETVLMLELAALQIEAAMTDSNASVDVLTRSFTTMASHMQSIAATLTALPGHGEMTDARNDMLGMTHQVSGMVHQAIIAFQFYDKLAQRLAHVGHSLGALSELVSTPSRLYNPAEWVELQNRIRSKYSMREEVSMFEAVIRGVPVQEAIGQYMAEMNERDDDVELF